MTPAGAIGGYHIEERSGDHEFDNYCVDDKDEYA
jgi:hypothetical protein